MYVSMYFTCYASKNVYIKLNLINIQHWDVLNLNREYTVVLKMEGA